MQALMPVKEQRKLQEMEDRVKWHPTSLDAKVALIQSNLERNDIEGALKQIHGLMQASQLPENKKISGRKRRSLSSRLKDTLPSDSTALKVQRVAKAVVEGDKHRTISSVRELVKRNPRDHNMLFLFAETYDLHGAEGLAQIQWERGLEIFSKSDILERRFRITGDNRNEFLTSGGAEYVSGLFGIKRSRNEDSESLDESIEREYQITAHFNDIMNDIVAQPIGPFHLDGRSYFMTKIAGKETLHDRLQKKDWYVEQNHVRDAIKLLAQVHTHGEALEQDAGIKLDDILDDNPHYFTRKLQMVFFGNLKNDPVVKMVQPEWEIIEEAHELINDRLAQQPRTFYKDHNPKNIVMGTYGGQVLIDFESNLLLPPQLDLVSLLEFGHRYLTDREIKGHVKAYMKEMKNLGTEFEKKPFLAGYHYAAVQRHLEFIGYRSRDANAGAPGNHRKMQAYHKQRVLHHIKKLNKMHRETKEFIGDLAVGLEMLNLP